MSKRVANKKGKWGERCKPKTSKYGRAFTARRAFRRGLTGERFVI